MSDWSASVSLVAQGSPLRGVQARRLRSSLLTLPMTETASLLEQAELAKTCSLCDRMAQGPILSVSALPENIRSILQSNAKNAERICARCIELFTRAQRQIESHQTTFEQNAFVLPTPLRMDADERFTGHGVTMAFLDSGFYAHHDLTEPRNRIVAYHSLFATDGDDTSLHTADVASWHGMMTSVVAAGSGALSDGVYRGIASEAD